MLLLQLFQKKSQSVDHQLSHLLHTEFILFSHLQTNSVKHIQILKQRQIQKQIQMSCLFTRGLVVSWLYPAGLWRLAAEMGEGRRPHHENFKCKLIVLSAGTSTISFTRTLLSLRKTWSTWSIWSNSCQNVHTSVHSSALFPFLVNWHFFERF